MDTDISNWLNFVEKEEGKINKKTKSKKRKREDNDKHLTDLKVTAIDNIYTSVEEMNVKGRELTNFLSKLEYTFVTTKHLLKRDSKGDDGMVLLLLALSSIMIEVIQDIKLESYEQGRKFNIFKYLKKIRKELTGEENPQKLPKYKDPYASKGTFSLYFEKPKIGIDTRKKIKIEDKKKDEDKDQEQYEEESEAETTDDDSYTKQGYVKDDFVVDDDSDYVPEEGEEDEEEYEDEEYEVFEEEEVCNDIVENSDNKKLNKKFLDELNKFSDRRKDSSEEAIKYFCSLDKNVRKTLLKKVKDLNSSDVTNEPLLFRIINLNIPKEQKNSIVQYYFAVKNSFSDNTKLKLWMANVMKLPFGKYEGINLNTIKKSEVKTFINDLYEKMNSAVWGHEEAKRKIIQMMGQKINNPESKGNVLGIYGVPGNGKTSLIKEGIAKAMKKPFVFISLGGAQDGSFLDGHSFTYEGSIYGRIARGLIESKCMDPIIYFDELDKISGTTKGEEIVNMLVHLIDPVQNSKFRDKYFHGIDLDLSKVTFIFSFNDPSKINHILMDRITTVETKYLIPVQKLKIAKDYLLPAIFEEMKMDMNNIKFSEELILKLINNYTYEGGVRKLKTLLYSIVREINVRNLINDKLNEKNVSYPYDVQYSDLPELLKDRTEIELEKIHENDSVGIVNGMWASTAGVGGIMSIETILYPSKSLMEIKATGSLEKVIKESIEVACSLAWSRLDKDTKHSWLKKWKRKPNGFHIHCPEGATPKDGPSAGAAMTLAFYSILTNRKINHEVSMTGEINLKGKVTKIGGLENKLQGAKFAGVKTALVPYENEKDLNKIKERNKDLINDDFKVILVKNFDDVLNHSLVNLKLL